jgi:adenylosuccinate synthase
MTISIITDLGYGDCGKGTTTDYLARQGSAVVVRHNGGPQAGHNVVTPDRRRHCFAQFGAGSFAGAKTFLSRFMLVNPLNMVREADHLIDLGLTDIWDRAFVDENAMLITPWHVALNRLQEETRGDSRHGSCGQGIGVAMSWSIDQPHSMTPRVKDILDPGFWPRLEAMRHEMVTAHRHLASTSPHWSVMMDSDLSKYLTDRYRDWSQKITIAPSNYLRVLIEEHDHTIFEGAQGVLLDEWYGFHPFTTWSTTTHENALTLLREVGRQEEAIRYGILRAVTTRHGAGPHPTESEGLTKNWIEPDNATGPWQGHFRVGWFDLVAHRYAVTVCGGVDRVVVTHLDNYPGRYCEKYDDLPKIPLGRRGDLMFQTHITETLAKVHPVLRSGSENWLLNAIEEDIGPVSIVSHGPTCENKREHAPLAT